MTKILGVTLSLCLVACGGGAKDSQGPGGGDAGWDSARAQDVRNPDGGVEDLPDLLPLEILDTGPELPPVGGPADLQDTGGELPDAGEDAGLDTSDVAMETDGGGGPPPCKLDLDCPTPGFCKGGQCQPLPECLGDEDCPEDLVACVEGKCLLEGVSPYTGAVRINELLSDGTTDEDANQDGSVDPMEDEFAELVVVSNADVDLSGWRIIEEDWDIWLPRHTFPAGTLLSPLTAVVVFGGGDAPDSTDTVLFATANAADPGTPYGLDLDDEGDELRLVDAEGLLVDVFAYGDAPPPASDQSLTRSPDLVGPWLPHLDAAGAAGAVFSPGMRVDGSPFSD